MRKITPVQIFVCLSLISGVCVAQFGRGNPSWATAGADAQRSAWVRTDAKISKQGVQQPEFRFLWKLKLTDKPGLTNSLTPAVLLSKYIGYRGFRNLALVAANGERFYGIDADLGRIEWNVNIGTAAKSTCEAGLTAGLARPILTAFPTTTAALGPGRGEPAKSGVGEPGQGAVILTERRPVAFRPAPTTPAPTVVPLVQKPRLAPITIYSLSADGMLHAMYVSTGLDDTPPIAFAPPNSITRGFIVADNIAYAATESCAGGANAIRALDLDSKQMSTWEATGAIAGAEGPAFGPDGTLYVALATGEILALDGKSLTVKDTYSAKREFVTSPLIFSYQQKVLAVAATKDGSLHLLNAESLGGADHYQTEPTDDASTNGSLAGFQDKAGTRWIFAPRKNTIAAWRLRNDNGTLSLAPAWVSEAIPEPSSPIIVNGIVFVASTKSPAVIYALDAATGKQLWSSGNVITASAHLGILSAADGQVYLGTDDGTLWVFGSWIERQ